MNIDILGSILSLYKNKQTILQYYLSDEVNRKLMRSKLFDPSTDELYLGDQIYLVNKSNLLLEECGKIVSIDDSVIKIKVKYKYMITFDVDNHHIFVEQKQTKKSQRNFYESLLNNL